MQVKVKNEAGFQILTSAMSIGPSKTGYVLEVSADGKNFSPLFAVAANTTKMATGLAPNAYYRLKGNVGEVIVNWSRSCVTEGGAAGNELTPVTEFPLNADPGTVVALASGDTYGIYQYDGTNWNEAGADVDLSAYWTSAQTEEAISAATSGKADAANVRPKTGRNFPEWNAQGIITGSTQMAWLTNDIVNGKVRKQILSNASSNGFAIYAPESAGTAGDILVSTGNGAPVWSAMPAADVTKAYVDSADTALQDQIDTMDEVVSTALVNLNERVDEISGNTSGDMSAYYTSAQTEDAISAATSGKADAVNIEIGNGLYFPTWNRQGIITGKYKQAYNPTSTINGKNKVFLDTNGNGGITIYGPESAGTAGDILVSTGNGAPVWSAVTMPDMAAYTPTSGFSTINGSAITNGGNIVIEGGADMSAYWTSAQTEDAISAATSGKADAANIAANTGNYFFPKWNKQGIISGVSQQVFESYLLVNDEGTGGYFFMNTSKYAAQNKALKLYTPLSAGTAGDILVSTGNGAPIWSSAVTQDMVTSTDIRHMVKLTQSEYNNLSVKDPETFYIIVNNN